MLQEEKTLLLCSHPAKKMGDFRLSDIDFALPAGYVLGVIGRNGSGKTTLARVLAGSYQIDGKGELILDGVSISEDLTRYKKRIAYVFNENPFPQMIHAMDCARIYGHYYEGFDKKKYEDLLKEFEVPGKVILKNLSKGQQIRQQLAFALSYDAKLYLLDEPAANLDVEFRESFYGYVRSMTEDGKRSVIYVSHLMDELEQQADYILWIGTKKSGEGKTGYQKFFGTMEELREQFQIIEMTKQEFKEIAVKSIRDKEVLKKIMQEELIAGIRERQNHQEMLVQIGRESLPKEVQRVSRYASLKEIMYYVEKGDGKNATDIDGTLDRE